MDTKEQSQPKEIIVTMQDDLKSATAAGLIRPTRPTIAMTQGLPPAKNLEGVHKNTGPGFKLRLRHINKDNSLTKPAEPNPIPQNLILWIAGIILTLILLAIIIAIIRQ